MLVMTSLAKDTGPRVPLILLSAAAEMDIAIEEGRAMDVNAISTYDTRVRSHPWYASTLHSPPAGQQSFTQFNAEIHETSHPFAKPRSRTVPPRFGRAGLQELSSGSKVDVSVATIPLAPSAEPSQTLAAPPKEFHDPDDEGNLQSVIQSVDFGLTAWLTKA